MTARRTAFLHAAALLVLQAALGMSACSEGGQATSSDAPAARPATQALPSAGPPTAPVPAVFPLRVQAGQRHLVDANGRPFQLRGDAAWGLITKLRPEEAYEVLADRQAKGFNAVVVMLVSHHRLIGSTANARGDEPFRTTGDFAAPNEAYFRHAEQVIDKAASLGLLVVLAPAYTGYGGTLREGWMPFMVAQGADKMRTYGRYLGTRFKGKTNILWLLGGDYNPASPTEKDVVRAVALGIRDALPDALQTFHGARHTAALQYWGGAEPWLNMNTIYTGQADVAASARAQHAQSPMPFFLVEAVYEGSRGADARVVRAQAYQALLSGAAGQVVGKEGQWEFNDRWREALDSEGARSMAPLARLFDSMPWWTLVPDTDGSLVRRGAGQAEHQAVGAVLADRSLALVYLPSPRSVTVDLARLRPGSVRASWVDPTSAAERVAAGGPLQASGAQSFAPPGLNGGRAGDWLLMLRSVP